MTPTVTKELEGKMNSSSQGSPSAHASKDEAATETLVSSAAHTPGPWTLGVTECLINGEPLPLGWSGVSADLACVVTRLSDEPFDDPSGVANAHLIAAAPDLRAALRMCIQRIERPNLSPDANVVLERARAAIAKAEGRS